MSSCVEVSLVRRRLEDGLLSSQNFGLHFAISRGSFLGSDIGIPNSFCQVKFGDGSVAARQVEVAIPGVLKSGEGSD